LRESITRPDSITSVLCNLFALGPEQRNAFSEAQVLNVYWGQGV